MTIASIGFFSIKKITLNMHNKPPAKMVSIQLPQTTSNYMKRFQLIYFNKPLYFSEKLIHIFESHYHSLK